MGIALSHRPAQGVAADTPTNGAVSGGEYLPVGSRPVSRSRLRKYSSRVIRMTPKGSSRDYSQTSGPVFIAVSTVETDRLEILHNDDHTGVSHF